MAIRQAPHRKLTPFPTQTASHRSLRSAGSIDLQPEGPVTSQGGFTIRMSTDWGGSRSGLPGSGSMGLSARVRFVPPGLVW